MRLMKERHAIYQKADLIFDVTEESPDKMATKLSEKQLFISGQISIDSNGRITQITYRGQEGSGYRCK